MGAGEEILKTLARLEGKIDKLMAGGNGGAIRVADDADLDGEHGDPEVKFSPKRWTGTDYKRARFSVCSPEFLDAYAEALQWSSEHPKAGKEQYASYDERDAARARGWAKRLRANPPPAADAAGQGADGLPF